MGVASGCGEQEAAVATGCGFKEVYRFPHTTYPGVLNWRYGAIHGARECQRAPIFFPAPQ